MAAFFIHVLALYVAPAQAILETRPVSVEQWAALVGLALSIAVVMEIHKWTWRRRRRPYC